VVRDTGIGIPSEKLQAIFAPFTQADSSTTREYGGTGLGLTISSQLIELMGGKMEIESEPGKGTTFTFIVPIARARKAGSRPTHLPVPQLRGLSVLVVDDNATNRLILSDTVASWGMHPTAVEDGRSALQLLVHAASSEPFSLVLLDAMMPVIDGFTLARQIREHAALRDLPILMLSSAGRVNPDRIAGLGIANYLLKPVKQSELLEAIQVALSLSSNQQPISAEGTSSHQSTLRVLLAEDNAINQRLAVRLLEREGHQVQVVATGTEVLARIQRERFDLVLMDVQMPEMDGLEATRRVRQREQTTGTHLPIIAMTAHAMKGDRERCLEAGMDDYIAKPILLKDLLDAIEHVLDARGRSSVADCQ
jgi:CheY-like chemotaxis protein